MHPVTRRLARASGAAMAAGVGVTAWASLVERNWFALRRFQVPVLPEGAEPLRVLHVSDLHLVPRQERKIEWVRRLLALDPDLVINTGDNIAAHDAVPAALRAFGDLLDRPGVFVMGSNDYFAPRVKNPLLYLTPDNRRELGTTPRLPTADLIDGFTSRGWVDLTNRRATLQVRGLTLEFAGVDDPHLDYDRLDLVRGPASPGTDLFVGVAHAPYQRVLDAYAEDGAQLLIAGHTHGGQVCVPGYGALVTNCDLDTSRVKGLSRWWPGAGLAAQEDTVLAHMDGRPGPGAASPSEQAPPDAAWLHVCAGLGTSPAAPVRLACRPEAALLTLVPRGTDSENGTGLR